MTTNFSRWAISCVIRGWRRVVPKLASGTAVTALSLQLLGGQGNLPPQVTHLEAFHRSGQTFLTFDEVQVERAGRVRYRVYRLPRPIRQIQGLTPLATISQDSSYNPRASNRRVEGRRVQLRIEEGKELPEGRGLFVYTVPEAGGFYYAVTAIVDGNENTALDSSNVLGQPVQEAVARPEPIFQGMTRAQDGLPAARYVHFVNANSTPLLPPMANTYDTRHIHFNFLLRNPDPQTEHSQPLVIGFHGGNGIFTEALQPTGNPEEILLGFDDPRPLAGYPPAINTLWFGFVPNLGKGEPSQADVVEPYTLRRIRQVVKWVERTFRVDSNRVYCAGTSFGAIGSLMYGLSYPQEIAAMWLNLPRYDFRADGPELIAESDGTGSKMAPAWDIERGGEISISARFSPLFGTLEQNLATPIEEQSDFKAIGEGLGVYERVNFRSLATVHPEVDLPVLLLYHAKFDNVTGWHEKPLMVKALEGARRPFHSYFLTAGHDFLPTDPFFEQAHQRSRLHEYSLAQAVVAFAHATNNDDLGDGLDMVRCARANQASALDLGQTGSFVRPCIDSPQGLVSGDRQGTVNGYLDWNRNDILDLSDRFEVSLFVLETARENEAKADITLGRLQNLRHAPGQKYRFENLELASGRALEPPRELEADELSRVVIPQVRIHKSGSRLRLQTIP